MQVFCQVKDQKLYPARQKRSVHGGHSWNNMFILQGVNCATGNGAGGSRGGGRVFYLTNLHIRECSSLAHELANRIQHSKYLSVLPA